MSWQRKERAKSQSIFLIEEVCKSEKERLYVMMGSTGNIYNVIISNTTSCTCPDSSKNHKRCKHIYFVLLKIMNTEDDKKEYSDEDLQQMFLNATIKIDSIYASKEIVNAYSKIKDNSESKTVNKKDTDDLCPICLDDLDNGEELDFCKYSCGKNIHKGCFNMWIKAKKPACVFCQHNWFEEKSEYVNIIEKIKKK